jgi:hypothetical protein
MFEMNEAAQTSALYGAQLRNNALNSAGQLGGSAGQLGGTGVTSGLQQVVDRMTEALKSLDNLVLQLAETETRLNGSRPTDKGSAGPAARPVPNGTVATLLAGMDEISMRIENAQQLSAMLTRSI